MIKRIATVLTFAALTATQASAQNTGFESGFAPAGYTTAGNTFISGANTNISPVEGSLFAHLSSDPQGTLGRITSSPFALAFGNQISFYANFLTNEGTPSGFNDFGQAYLLDSFNANVATIYTRNTGSVFTSGSTTVNTQSYNEQTGWEYILYTSTLASGNYKLVFEVNDFGDSVVASGLLIDGVGAGPPTVTPEPVTMTLLGTGLAGIAAARRRRQKAA